jgi:hypothetical protein
LLLVVVVVVAAVVDQIQRVYCLSGGQVIGMMLMERTMGVCVSEVVLEKPLFPDNHIQR